MVVLILCLGCSSQTSDLLPDKVACDSCNISADTIVTIRGENVPWPVTAVVQNHRGGYVLFSSAALPTVFDSQGVFLRTIGRRGQGPGEMRMALSGWVLPPDSFAVLETFGTTHVFGPEFEYARSLIVPIPIIHSVLVRNWPDAVLISGSIDTPDLFGVPFHLVDFSEPPARIADSFGAIPDEVIPPYEGMAFTAYELSAGEGDTWWSARSRTYTLSEWSGTNERIRTIERRPKWFSEPSDMMIGGPNTPPSPAVTGLFIDARNILWVFARVASPEWPKAHSRAQLYEGATEVPGDAVDTEYLYRSRVEAIDPERKVLLATHAFNSEMTSVLSGGMAAFAVTDDGVPEVHIVQLRLNGTRH